MSNKELINQKIEEAIKLSEDDLPTMAILNSLLGARHAGMQRQLCDVVIDYVETTLLPSVQSEINSLDN